EEEDGLSLLSSPTTTTTATTSTTSRSPYIWESIQIRHAGLSSIVSDLGLVFNRKRELIQAERMLKTFLDSSAECQYALREIRSRLYDSQKITGFILDDTETRFNEY